MGAALSLLDFFTDVDAIYRFYQKRNYEYMWTNLIFIGLAMLLALAFVFVQNFKRGWKVIAYEMLIVVTMTKPGLDARRVACGNVTVDNTVMNPEMGK